MKEFELVFRRGALDRCRPVLGRLVTSAPVEGLIFDVARDRARLLCPNEAERQVLGAIEALGLPLLGLHVGELREPDAWSGD